MSDFDGVPQSTVRVDRETDASLHERVSPARQHRGGREIAGQQVEEIAHSASRIFRFGSGWRPRLNQGARGDFRGVAQIMFEVFPQLQDSVAFCAQDR